MRDFAFHSVLGIVRAELPRALCRSQSDFFDLIFSDLEWAGQEPWTPTPSSIHGWLTGGAPAPDRLVAFYADAAHRKAMERRIRADLLPRMTDSALAVRRIRLLLMAQPDDRISSEKKAALCALTGDTAVFLTAVIWHAMRMPVPEHPAR